MTTVTFDGFELPSVDSVEVGNDLATDALVDATTLRGLRRKTITVKGLIKRASTRDAMLAEQKALEDTLVAKGKATFSYPGGADFDARIVGLAFSEWDGGPVIYYTAGFQTDEPNPWTEAVTITDTTSAVVLSDATHAITLDPRPSISDGFKSVDAIDEVPNATKDKTLTLSGTLKGTLTEVKTKMADLKAMLTLPQAAGVAVKMTITTPSGLYYVRVSSFSFGIPAGRDLDSSVSYAIEFATPPDFSLENKILAGGPLTIGGISMDVATSYNHQVGRSNTNEITSETINASGKVFFTSITDADTYKATVDGVVVTNTTISSPTGKTLRIAGANWSEPARDGNFADGSRRYSMSVSLSLQIDTATESGGGLSGVVLGVSFVELTSVSYSVTFDDNGNAKSRSKSGSGKIAKGTTPATSAGSKVTEDGYAYYVTSLNLGGLDDTGRRTVSVSGNTIDSALQAEELFPLVFAGFALDHVDSQNKSRSVRFNTETKFWEVSSISASVSGFKIGSNGAILDLIDTLSSFDGAFIITSVSTGAPDRVRNNDGALEHRYPISISGTLNVFGANDEADDGTPDIDIQEARSITDPTTKYRQVPIPGLGVVDKKIGLNPGEETVTVRHVAKTREIYNAMAYPADPVSATGGTKYSRSTNEQGLTKSVTVRFRNRTDFAEV